MTKTNTAKADKIRELFGAGQSYSQIAEALGTTRSAVAGYCSRMGLRRSNEYKRQANINNSLKAAAIRVAAAPKVTPKVLVATSTHTPDRKVQIAKASKQLRGDAVWAPIEGATPIMLMDANPNQCRWPVGRHQFCGQPVTSGLYCAVHHSKAVRSTHYEGKQDRAPSAPHGNRVRG